MINVHIRGKILASLCVLCLTLLLAPEGAAAQQLNLETGEVEFHSSTPVERFTGQTTAVSGTLDLDTGSFSFAVELDSVSTGIGRRDRAMREDYLKTHDYPQVTYEGQLQELPDPDLDEVQEVTATGVFTLRGIEREMEINGHMQYDRENESWGIRASFHVLLSDHDISRPRILFIRMHDEQELQIRFEMKE